MNLTIFQLNFTKGLFIWRRVTPLTRLSELLGKGEIAGAIYEGGIGGYSEPQCREQNREIPQYRGENSMNTETAWMDKTKYRTEAAKLPKYRTKNTTIPKIPMSP